MMGFNISHVDDALQRLLLDKYSNHLDGAIKQLYLPTVKCNDSVIDFKNPTKCSCMQGLLIMKHCSSETVYCSYNTYNKNR